MTNLSYEQIFVPGGNPSHTYNPRNSLKLEDKVGEVLKNLCKLVIVTGHTKSGKTVLVRKVIPREKAIWIDGGGIRTEDDFWTSIIQQLELFQVTESQTNIGAGIGGIGGSLTNKYSRDISSMTTALIGLRNNHKPLVIDDFHYLNLDFQGNLIRALKPLIFDGLSVVIIAIPHRRYDAVKVEKEMTGRIFPVNIPLWKKSELVFIPNTGFPLLDKQLKLDSNIIDKFAEESIGSPHLMQEFCRRICKVLERGTELSIELTNRVFSETAETIGRPIFEKLARGPRQRSDRIPRKLKTGGEVDIYRLVLHGLAHLRPGLITLEYEDLRSAIKKICKPENVPNVQEIARVLKRMSEIAASDRSSTPVIDFEEKDKRLHITDPFFAFYLRWGNISK